jgi:hypothetical protein
VGGFLLGQRGQAASEISTGCLGGSAFVVDVLHGLDLCLRATEIPFSHFPVLLIALGLVIDRVLIQGQWGKVGVMLGAILISGHIVHLQFFSKKAIEQTLLATGHMENLKRVSSVFERNGISFVFPMTTGTPISTHWKMGGEFDFTRRGSRWHQNPLFAKRKMRKPSEFFLQVIPEMSSALLQNFLAENGISSF